MTEDKNLVIVDNIEIQNMIYTIRDKQVMVDSDLAILYKVTTKRLNEQVRRNKNRFPSEFMFRLTSKEYEYLRSQNATSSEDNACCFQDCIGQIKSPRIIGERKIQTYIR